jgi:hypothetical protein
MTRTNLEFKLMLHLPLAGPASGGRDFGDAG